MKNTIYNQIKANTKLNFNEIFSLNSTILKDKYELGNLIKILESEKLIFKYSNDFYDLASFEEVSGFIHWNLNGFCWLSTKQEVNEWGLGFDLSDNLLSIYNKRSAYYGHFAYGKKISIDGNKEFIYITHSKPTKNIKLMAIYQKKRNEWVVLNSGTNFSFKNFLGNTADGTIAVFSSFEHKLIDIIGNINDYGIESKIVQMLGEIHEAPEIGNEINKENYSVDLKAVKVLNKPFYTIDSIKTKDIDDAIWMEKDNDNFKLWVAIADVSSTVVPNNQVDQHAKRVCSSFYLPHKTIHMLNRSLAEEQLSLNIGKIKNSLICEMQFDSDLNLINTKFYVANIKTKFKLTYNDVNKILHNETPEESYTTENENVIPLTFTPNELLQSLEILKDFKEKVELNQKEQENKYWFLPQPEMILGENGKIEKLENRRESTIAEKMVEKAMLVANIAAAKYIYEFYPEFGLFRNQNTPLEGDVPKPAFYQSKNTGHWGLNTQFYTHFTSPIRRYCDLIVHRLIKSIIYKQDKTYLNEQLQEIATQINLQQYKSKQFEIKVKNLLIPQYIESLLNDDKFTNKFEVVDINKNGLVLKNNQKIELFLPSFKLDKSLSEELTNINRIFNLTEVSKEDKENIIKNINDKFKIVVYIDDFVWTDERKNIFIKTYLKNDNHNKITI